MNIRALTLITLFLATFVSPAFAATDSHSTFALGGGLAMGLAAIGATLAQGKSAVAALEGMARNPGAAPAIRGSLILSLALIESIVILVVILGIGFLNK